jgi:hypothetical protein
MTTATDSSSPAMSAPAQVRNVDVAINTTESVMQFLRPDQSLTASQSTESTTSLLIENDASIHYIPDSQAEEPLNTFHTAFISRFPFIHLPTTIGASELRRQKPFLWLVIIALTTKSVSKQFEIADTIWNIISRRVVYEHHVSLDLLQGIICFASWYAITPYTIDILINLVI